MSGTDPLIAAALEYEARILGDIQDPRRILAGTIARERGRTPQRRAFHVKPL